MILGILIGIFIGSIATIFILSLCHAAGEADIEGNLQEFYYGQIKDLENELKASNNQCDHLTDSMHKLSEENLTLKIDRDNYKWVLENLTLVELENKKEEVEETIDKIKNSHEYQTAPSTKDVNKFTYQMIKEGE